VLPLSLKVVSSLHTDIDGSKGAPINPDEVVVVVVWLMIRHGDRAAGTAGGCQWDKPRSPLTNRSCSSWKRRADGDSGSHSNTATVAAAAAAGIVCCRFLVSAAGTSYCRTCSS